MGAALFAAAFWPSDARAAAAQDWSPFVLVAGLLLIGLVADRDGLFAVAGHRLAQAFRGGPALFAGAAVLIGFVTAVLNLDTSVAFLTPVFVYTARSRGNGEAPLLFGCLLLSNAGSLFLPGSNLTNLIVLGHLHLTGGEFFGHMWLAALVALIVTAVVIGVVERRSLGRPRDNIASVPPSVKGVGLWAVVVATVLVVALPYPAIPVVGVGIAAVMIRFVQRNADVTVTNVAAVLGLPILAGIFGLAVAFGTLGRVWSAPTMVLAHLNEWGTAGAAAMVAVFVNNLPAASLLAARTPTHPYALLVGLNLGPNLFVTGSLAWILWLRAASTAGVSPSIRRAALIGVIAVPLSITAAVAVLILTGPS